ncbi:hypothetical protein SCB71_12095 [Herbiconiux sp. KACC 21604]|uniref:hypothetical protein n=1 Tax=unclassified Herbiconiux TaxID=2618217 RepID=UPI001493006A|nr:hypothetical protein [Herbiconiux sp. SALV-R1]QJU53933.1 hypothetical protein HL652_10045 [Herbiconiux sp. SALV-R1]WPO84958.1 hypothetical protein SCB71_12095 [Herbiconiux sp. KACC 21604]
MSRSVPLPHALAGGPFTLASGAGQGLSEKRMRGADLAKPFSGVRTTPEDGFTLLGRCAAYALLMPEGHVFSHSTAARLWGMPLPESLEIEEHLHVAAIDGTTRPRSAGVRGHEVLDSSARVHLRSGFRVLDPVTVWLQLAASLGLDDLVAAGDHLVMTPRFAPPGDERPYASVDEMISRVRAFRGRGKKNASWAVGHVRDGAESRRETLLRLELLRHGLPTPELNTEIVDDSGARIGFGDIVFRHHGVLVEYDGEQHRTSSRQYYRDVERLEALHRAGWIDVRVTRQTPRTGPASAVARTERALRSRGWAPPA